MPCECNAWVLWVQLVCAVVCRELPLYCVSEFWRKHVCIVRYLQGHGFSDTAAIVTIVTIVWI